MLDNGRMTVTSTSDLNVASNGKMDAPSFPKKTPPCPDGSAPRPRDGPRSVQTEVWAVHPALPGPCDGLLDAREPWSGRRVDQVGGEQVEVEEETVTEEIDVVALFLFWFSLRLSL